MKETDITIYPLIVRYLDGTATIRDKKRLLLWLKETPEHIKEYFLIRDIWLSTETELEDDETGKAFLRLKSRITANPSVKKTTHSYYMPVGLWPVWLSCWV
ncbi:MAG: hypothetical protein LUE98_13150 [Tannerellaceae bacterium]|nr:hypothetical protein [Tannerellaceae bacterium]